jgi:hypothetical protein
MPINILYKIYCFYYHFSIDYQEAWDSMGHSHIATLFMQHEAKKISPSPSSLVVDDEKIEDGGILLTLIDFATPVQSNTDNDIGSEDATPYLPSPQQPSPSSYDAHFLTYDWRERIHISR